MYNGKLGGGGHGKFSFQRRKCHMPKSPSPPPKKVTKEQENKFGKITKLLMWKDEYSGEN